MAEETTPPKDRPPSLRQLIREDYLANGSDWTLPGFRAVAVYRFGVWRMSIRSRLLRAPLSFLYKRMYRYIRNHYGIELHYTTKVGRRFQIGHQSAIVIHHHSTIGDDCTLRQGVTIGGARAGVDQAPTIGSRVNIGAGAIIIGRITIGDDVTIGPNAVVMQNVPPGSTCTAMPARVIPPAQPRPESAES